MAVYGFMGFGAKSELDGVEWIPLRVLRVRLLRQLKETCDYCTIDRNLAQIVGLTRLKGKNTDFDEFKTTKR